MKSISIGAREKIEINAQVEKVLRGLGNPKPPLRLDDVRELLKLDRHYYSSTDDSVLREFISKIKIGAMQLILRPTLIFDVVKKPSCPHCGCLTANESLLIRSCHCSSTGGPRRMRSFTPSPSGTKCFSLGIQQRN